MNSGCETNRRVEEGEGEVIGGVGGQEGVMWSELFQKQAPVCCRVVRPLPPFFWFPLLELPGYSEVRHVPGKASGSS